MILTSHKKANTVNRIQNRTESWTLDTSGNKQAVLDPGQGRRVYSTSGNSVTLAAHGGGQGAKTGLYSVNDGIRRLTPLECERLQSFPDNWTQYGHDGKPMSDTQRYKMVGNAVTVSVIQDIMGALSN